MYAAAPARAGGIGLKLSCPEEAPAAALQAVAELEKEPQAKKRRRPSAASAAAAAAAAASSVAAAGAAAAAASSVAAAAAEKGGGSGGEVGGASGGGGGDNPGGGGRIRRAVRTCVTCKGKDTSMWWSNASDNEDEYMPYSATSAPTDKPLKCDKCMDKFRQARKAKKDGM